MNPKTKEIIFGSNTEETSTSSSFDDDYNYESYDDGSAGTLLENRSTTRLMVKVS